MGLLLQLFMTKNTNDLSSLFQQFFIITQGIFRTIILFSQISVDKVQQFSVLIVNQNNKQDIPRFYKQIHIQDLTIIGQLQSLHIGSLALPYSLCPLLILTLFKRIKLTYNMLSTQTPFSMIQRRDKQRKMNMLNNIEKKDISRRSISYNFKATDNTCSENAQLNDKAQTKDQFSQLKINSSIKKSYYYRKLLNKSIDNHMTSQEFQKIKERFEMFTKMDTSKEKKPSFFREIWERELQKKQNFAMSDQQNYLEVISRNPEKEKTLYLESQFQIKKTEEEKAKDILDIAQERKTTLNFDLQILGNKKSIRIKDNRNKSKANTTANMKTIDVLQREDKETHEKIDQRISSAATIQPENKLDKSSNKAICSFFKRFQQENSEKKSQIGNNEFLQITKINQSLFPFSTTNYDNYKLKKLKLREYQSEVQTREQSSIIRREIQSSWKPNARLSAQRPKNVQTSHEKRGSMIKEKRIQLPSFTNDIKGWIVGQQNDEDYLQTFQN